MKLHLLTDGNSKTKKNTKIGYYTAILHLAPNTQSGRNTCPNSSPSCRANCLWYAGGFRYPKIRQITIDKTNLFFDNREKFLNYLHSDLYHIEELAAKAGLKPSVRLNGTSDIRWHKVDVTLFTKHPNINFYDYTKNPDVAIDFIKGKLPTNYHITFSRSEINDKFIQKHIQGKMQVAMVVDEKLKDSLLAAKNNDKIDGDEHDARFKNNVGIVLLKAKHKAKTEKNGFVIR